MQKQKLLEQVMRLAILLNETSEYEVSFEFSGHVNMFDIKLSDPKSGGSLVEAHIFLNNPGSEAKLVEVGSNLSDILTTGEIDYSRLNRGRYAKRTAYFLCYDALYCNRDTINAQ